MYETRVNTRVVCVLVFTGCILRRYDNTLKLEKLFFHIKKTNANWFFVVAIITLFLFLVLYGYVFNGKNIKAQ